MLLIAHRGNIKGRRPDLENSPFYLLTALEKGYDVEVDVWYNDDKWYLGHDSPQYLVERVFVETKGFWCHAKNLQALESMIECGIHCFWHQEDDFTLTSKGYLWTYPGKPVCSRSILVCKDEDTTLQMAQQDIKGICSDYVEKIRA